MFSLLLAWTFICCRNSKVSDDLRAIIRANVDQDICHHMALLGHNELKMRNQLFQQTIYPCLYTKIHIKLTQNPILCTQISVNSSDFFPMHTINEIDALVQGCSNSSALTMDLLEFCSLNHQDDLKNLALKWLKKSPKELTNKILCFN